MAGFQSRFGKVTAALAAAGIVAVALTGCGDGKKEASADGFTVVKVGVVGDYNAQWDTVNNLLKKDKIQVKLVKFSDYATPNRALADGEIDLNAFQHKAYLKNDIERNGYKIEAIGDTLITPLRVFNNKNKLKSMKDVKDGDIFAIPSDLTNGGRALKVLEAAGLRSGQGLCSHQDRHHEVQRQNSDSRSRIRRALQYSAGRVSRFDQRWQRLYGRARLQEGFDLCRGH